MKYKTVRGWPLWRFLDKLLFQPRIWEPRHKLNLLIPWLFDYSSSLI